MVVIEDENGGLETPEDAQAVSGNQVGTLSELLLDLSHSIEPSESIGLFYHSGLWGAEVQLDNSLKKRPLVPSAYGRNGHTPKEAMSKLVSALRQDGVIDLKPSDAKANIKVNSKSQRTD